MVTEVSEWLEHLENMLSGLAQPVKQLASALYNNPNLALTTAKDAAYTFVETHPLTCTLAVGTAGLTLYAYKKGLFSSKEVANCKASMGVKSFLGGFNVNTEVWVGKAPKTEVSLKF